jgi:hypothetical protein
MTLYARAWPLTAVVVLAACEACGNGDPGVDGPPDPCAPKMTFTGEYVDWDSGASFMGIPQATFALRGDPALTDQTAPNGRFEMCIPPADGFVDITPMTGSSYVGGTVVVDHTVLQFLPVQSYRSFTAMRSADFAFDASKAHVYVHVVGAANTVVLGKPAGVTKIFDGSAWVDGATGTDFYFGNVATGGPTKLTVTGAPVYGGASVPLTAGAFTYVTLRER